jgi:hypothetical protein
MLTKDTSTIAVLALVFLGCGDSGGETADTSASATVMPAVFVPPLGDPAAAAPAPIPLQPGAPVATQPGAPVATNPAPPAAPVPVNPAAPAEMGEVAPVAPAVDPIAPAVDPVAPAVDPVTPAVDPIVPAVDPVAPGDMMNEPEAMEPEPEAMEPEPEAMEPEPVSNADVVDTGAAEDFSFFVTSYYHIAELSGSPDGFGGDLRYNGAATGLDGADAICQEIGRRVGFGHRSWKAFLSTSTENAIDRIGSGPWYDHAGSLVSNDLAGLTSDDRQAGGCCDSGTYDELGLFHDGKTDQNNDGIEDDDHDTMTATRADGTYSGFDCEGWTSVTATYESEEEDEGGAGGGFPGGGFPGGGFNLNGGIMMGHSWPAQSGQGWTESHAGHSCAAGTNFIQDGIGDQSTVGGGGGYGGFYCFAAD